MDIQALKREQAVKLSNGLVPIHYARLVENVVVEDPDIIVEAGCIGCLFNEFGQLLFVPMERIEGTPELTLIPVDPDEVELL